jgi:hypothetical protein
MDVLKQKQKKEKVAFACAQPSLNRRAFAFSVTPRDQASRFFNI